MFKMEIKQRDSFKVVGLQITSSVQECIKDNPHPKLWDEFLKRIDEIKNRKGKTMYGVCEEVTKENCDFISIACVEVDNLENIPEGMVGKEVPASRYAIFEHKGKFTNLNDVYARLYEKDMPESGLKQKKIWLEVYDERFKHDSDDSIMEIWVSVE